MSASRITALRYNDLRERANDHVSLRVEGVGQIFNFRSNLDEVKKQLEKLHQNVASLNGKHDVPLNELLNPQFMTRFTDYHTLDEFFERCGFHIESHSDFEQIPEEEMDQQVVTHTQFSSWSTMLQKAVEVWAKGKLSL